MPVRYEIDAERGRVHTRCTGEVTIEEVMAHFGELAADPARPGRLDVLLDLTRTETIPSSDEIGRVAEKVASLAGSIRWGHCAVVASRDVLFGMGRVFQAFVDDQFSHTNVFRGLDEAERWLDAQRPPKT